MLVPDPDPRFVLVWWSVMSVALIVIVYAAIVLAMDVIRSARPDDPRRSEIRARLTQLEEQDKPATRVDETRVAPITPRRSGGARR